MGWTLKELFNKKTLKMLRKAVLPIYMRLLRMFVIVVILLQFRMAAVIPTQSMYPTIQPKDAVIVDMTRTHPNRNDIISFDSPEIGANVVYVKRVIAIPGDVLEIYGMKVFINGNEVFEPFIWEPPFYEVEKMVIPENTYFVLGDNRNDSYDSTYFGVIPQENINGIVTRIVLPFSRFQEINPTN